jgi:hypothetical protein
VVILQFLIRDFAVRISNSPEEFLHSRVALGPEMTV